MNEAIHRATLVNATPNSVLFGNNTFLNNSGDDGGDVVDATTIIPQFNPISDPIGIDLYFQCLLFNEPTIVPLLPLSSSLSSPVVSPSPGLGPVLSSSAVVMMEKTVPSSSSSSSTLPPPPHRRRCDDPDFNNNNNSNINNNNNTHNMGGILGLLLLPVPQFMNINRCRYSNNTNNNNDTESTATLSPAAAAATTIKNTTFETDNNTKAKPNNNNKPIPILGTKEAYNYLKSVALHIRVLEWALAGGDDDDDDDDCDYNGYGDSYGDDSYGDDGYGDDGYSNDDYDDDNDDCNNEYESNSNNNNNNDMDMEMKKEEENGINDHRNDNVFWKTNHQKKSLPYYANDILEVRYQ